MRSEVWIIVRINDYGVFESSLIASSKEEATRMAIEKWGEDSVIDAYECVPEYAD
jgi:hypothetical protein